MYVPAMSDSLSNRFLNNTPPMPVQKPPRRSSEFSEFWICADWVISCASAPASYNSFRNAR